MSNGTQGYRALFISITLGVAIVLRLYPTLFNGAPWGTDSWPLFKDAQQLLANTPTLLGGNSATFADQYNIYWPGSIIFGAISSLIFNTVPIEVMPIIIPIVSGVSTLFLFVIVEKLTGSTIAAFIASLLFTTAAFDSIFTASVTKETFAYPLFMLGILILALSLTHFSSRNLVLFVLVSAGLVMSHYAIALIFAAIVGSVFIGQLIVSFSSNPSNFDFRLGLMPLSLFIVMSGYFAYAWRGFAIPVNLSDVLSLTSFLIISIVVSLYFTLKKEIPVTIPALILGVALVILAISAIIPLVPFEPIIPSSLLFDAIPYLFVGLLALIGHEISHRSFSREKFSFLAIWLAIPLGLFGFSIFGTPNGLDFLYRLFTFIYLPAAIFAGIALASFIEKNHGIKFTSKTASIPTLKKAGVGVVILVIAILCIYQTYAAAAQGQNLLGGQWGYTPSDIASATFSRHSIIQSMGVSGDSKIYYLYDQYYGISVNVAGGYQILIQGIANESSSPLVTDGIMQQDGYNIQLYGNPLPSDWQSNLVGHSSLIYTNGNDRIWY